DLAFRHPELSRRASTAWLFQPPLVRQPPHRRFPNLHAPAEACTNRDGPVHDRRRPEFVVSSDTSEESAQTFDAARRSSMVNALCWLTAATAANKSRAALDFTT